MTPQQTKEYAAYRLRLRGWTGNPTLTDAAVHLIYSYTAGNRKDIAKLCDRLLPLRKLTKKNTITRVIAKMAIDGPPLRNKPAGQPVDMDRDLLSIEQLATELETRMRSAEKRGPAEGNVVANRIEQAHSTSSESRKPRDGDQTSSRDGQIEEGKPKILIVDDSLTVRTILNSALSSDFTCIEAADGEEGWDALTNDPQIELAVVDLEMPALDGYGLIRRIRAAKNKHIATMPLIVVTALKDTIAKQEAYRAGANDFITKTIEPFELLVRIRTYHQLAQAQKALQKSQHETARQTKVREEKTERQGAGGVATNREPSAVKVQPGRLEVPTLTKGIPSASKKPRQPAPGVRPSNQRFAKLIHLQATTGMTLAATILAAIVVTGIVYLNRFEPTPTDESTELIQADATLQEEQTFDEHEKPSDLSQQVAADDLSSESADRSEDKTTTEKLTVIAHAKRAAAEKAAAKQAAADR
ncbi:MAG: response regulator, partial [Acidiferrobacterales bacterium]